MAPLRPDLAVWVAERFPGADLRTLAGDASTRLFHRLTLPGGATRVLMDYGAPFDGETNDIALSRLFWAAGLPTAAILDSDGTVGCLVLEDLGDRSLESVLAQRPSAQEDPVPDELRQAVLLAARVAVDGSPLLAVSDRSGGPALDAERFRFEMEFFLEHYVADLKGRADQVEPLRATLHALAERASAGPRRVLCHRDFHSRNLMVRQDGALAMIDIQDARWGPDSYDLASIVRDAYARIPEPWVDSLVDLYAEAIGEPEIGRFRQRLEVVSIQRMIKALGSFGYLTRRWETGRYLASIPPTLERIRRLLHGSELLSDLAAELHRSGLLTDPREI